MPAATAADLAAIPLFVDLSEAERAELAALFEVRDVGAGVRLVGEGTTGNSFFVVGAGALRVDAADGRTASLGPGDFFGEIALLEARRRTANVTTLEPARVLVLFATDFRRLRDGHPAIVARIEAAMRERRAGA